MVFIGDDFVSVFFFPLINSILTLLVTHSYQYSMSWPPSRYEITKFFFRRLTFLITEFTNDDTNGNDNVKKAAIVLLSETTTLHVHHAFLHITVFSLPSLQDCNVICLISRIMEDEVSGDIFFFLFSNVSAVLKKSTSGKFPCIWHFKSRPP